MTDDGIEISKPDKNEKGKIDHVLITAAGIKQ